MSTIAFYPAESYPDKDGDTIMDHTIYKDSMVYYFEGDWVEGGEVRDYEVEYFYDEEQNQIGVRTVLPPLNSAVERAEWCSNKDYVLPLNEDIIEHLCQDIAKMSLQNLCYGPVHRVARRHLAHDTRHLVVKKPIARSPPSRRPGSHSLETTVMLSILLSSPPPSVFAATTTPPPTPPSPTSSTSSTFSTSSASSASSTSSTSSASSDSSDSSDSSVSSVSSASSTISAASLPMVEDSYGQEEECDDSEDDDEVYKDCLFFDQEEKHDYTNSSYSETFEYDQEEYEEFDYYKYYQDYEQNNQEENDNNDDNV